MMKANKFQHWDDTAFLAARYRKAGSFATRYWTPDVQATAFALPRFIAGAMAKVGG